MRALLLTSAIALLPVLGRAQPQCTIPPGPRSPVSLVADPASLQASDPQPSSAPSVPSVTAAASLAEVASLPPALRHVTEAGAHVTETGHTHGLRDFVARNGQQFMFLHGTPDGQAVVAGIVSDLTPEQLVAAAGGQMKEIGVSHGLRGIFVSNGAQFQVFYATPDGARVIPGAMWDAAGKNLTRDQVSLIPGTVQAVDSPPANAGPSTPALPIVEKSVSGAVGDPEAPKVWMFVDPLCPFSVRAMQQLQPMIADRRLQLAVVPISINDYENGGRSTRSALAMLSLPPGEMVPAWEGGRLDAPASPDASARLDANGAAAKAVGLRGTPTLIWRKADGSEGRSDGLPADLAAFAASVGR